ncbi:MAG: ACT domain-containing protein [Acetanaerobacterium sp.]
MFIKQLSVFVENKPGRLSDITATLEKQQIDIRALSIADTTDFGILRLIVSNPDEAEKSLKEAGFAVSLTQVIAIGIEDRPGGLSRALTMLYEANIGVEYMYAFISREGEKAYVILRVEDNGKAVEMFRNNGIDLLESSDIYSM